MIRPFVLFPPMAMAAAAPLLAADLPRRSVSPVFVAPAEAFDWTGGYAGVNLGVGLANSLILNRTHAVTTERVSEVLNTLKSRRLRVKDAGVLGGGQIGFNYQVTPGSGLVVGFELDAQYADLRKRRNTAGVRSWSDTTDFDRIYTESAGELSQTGLDFLGTARGRVGYGFDRVLVYGTAGLAYGTISYRGAITDTYRWASSLGTGGSETSTYSTQSHRLQAGYVVGGGVEYALPADSFLNFFGAATASLKAEYLHFDFGHHRIDPSSDIVAEIRTKPNGVSAKSVTGVDTFRAGINYRFGIF